MGKKKLAYRGVKQLRKLTPPPQRNPFEILLLKLCFEVDEHVWFHQYMMCISIYSYFLYLYAFYSMDGSVDDK